MAEIGIFYADEGFIGGHSPPYEVFRMGGVFCCAVKVMERNGLHRPAKRKPPHGDTYGVIQKIIT